MKKRIMSLAILCAVLTATACGNGAAEGGETTTEPEETTTEAPETSEFEPASLSMDDGDFIIAENDIGDWMQSAFVTEENGEVLNDSIYKRNKIVEDLYKVNIKGYKIQGGRNSQQLTELTNSILAGDK